MKKPVLSGPCNVSYIFWGIYLEWYAATARILFVFDASQSMSAFWDGEERIQTARRILVEMVDSLEKVNHVQMALRVYGHQSPVPPQDCSDTRLEVPFAEGNASDIRQKLRFIVPRGTTPIAGSLAQVIDDFPPCPGCRNIVILITDGIEACDGDPCAVSLELQKEGIILKPFVIGIGLDPGFKETFDCVGYYFNVQTADKFREVMTNVINHVLNKTTTQVNLLDENGIPTETNVNMTFYDFMSGKIRYNYIHTLNQDGNPDTLDIDHLAEYKLEIHTIPPVTVDSIKLDIGTHNIIKASVPQGYLNVKTSRAKVYDNIVFTVRKQGELKTLSNQKVNDTGKYLTGKYELEIPVIPGLIISDVNIQQSLTTIIDIPAPGTVTFTGSARGYGSLYIIEPNKQTHIYNLSPTLRQQTIFMQPGNYSLIFRSANTKESINTIRKDFSVESGKSITIELQ